ncbi:MAG: sigma-70 family RNA polymerase sigma factor [Myxococcales bacterium]|nr:sigma-70 family RNA polymerase sigma factor [Myxococcales bacterium]
MVERVGHLAPDYELLRAWRGDDAAAGNELVRRHFASVFSFLRSKVPDHVDDLVQRTFLACVESVERIDESRSFRAYLFGIARRQLIYHYRRDRHSDRFDPMRESVHDAGGGSPSQHAAARQEQRLVLEALHRLPLDLQIPLELHYWETLSVAEVAAVLEIPPGTVKSRLHRARELLRDRLREQGASSALLEASLDHLRALEASRRPEGAG